MYKGYSSTVALQGLFVLEVNTGSKDTRGYSCSS